jgi:hypothetical protein
MSKKDPKRFLLYVCRLSHRLVGARRDRVVADGSGLWRGETSRCPVVRPCCRTATAQPRWLGGAVTRLISRRDLWRLEAPISSLATRSKHPARTVTEKRTKRRGLPSPMHHCGSTHQAATEAHLATWSTTSCCSAGIARGSSRRGAASSHERHTSVHLA